MSKESKIKQVMEMKVEGKNRRKETKIKWEDTIKRVSQGNNSGY